MLTKFILHIGETEYELKDDDLRNWDEIRCSYKRTSYDGVVRSFTSQFEFVNKAKELLLEIYLKDRYNAQAYISVHTLSDRWVYEERFRCPLDFSTVSWESYTLKINSVDNSLAALIKANKSTKYEFAVGSDILPDSSLGFDRLPMIETLAYQLTEGESYEDSADIDIRFHGDGLLPFMGIIGSEISVGRAVEWDDDQTNDLDSYILKANKDIAVTLEWDLEWYTVTDRAAPGKGPYLEFWDSVDLSVAVTRDGETVHESVITSLKAYDRYFVGKYATAAQLPSPAGLKQTKRAWALVSDLQFIYELVEDVSGSYRWVNENGKTIRSWLSKSKGETTLNLKTGDTVSIRHSLKDTIDRNRRFTKNNFNFRWLNRGDNATIDVFRPESIAKELLRKIAGTDVEVRLSDHDQRLPLTYLMAAESARGLVNAKLYISFSEFCDWMSTVFGYTYYIVNPQYHSPNQSEQNFRRFGIIVGLPDMDYSAHYDGKVEEYLIHYDPEHGCFFYMTEDGIFRTWTGSEYYNNPSGHPRTDIVYIGSDNDCGWVFGDYCGEPLYPEKVEINLGTSATSGPKVYFVHRSEIFDGKRTPRKIGNCRSIEYSVDTSAIYSQITVGYDHKDYDSINGRDEFNFNNTYTTGCPTSDKRLSLISKLRADCYGIEFAVQKRGENTTDTTSDQDVFFVLCTMAGNTLYVDRSIKIRGGLSDSLFNGAFTPMACIRANAGYIGLQAEHLRLTFASSTGNSSITVGGERMNGDIKLDTPFATCGTIEFTTDEVDDIADVNELIEVEDDGMLYRGFIKEVDIKYAKTEAAKYKLIVKDIEL